MTTITWKISNLDRTVADGIVTTVHYTVTAEDGTYNAGAYGSIGLQRPEEGADDVIPFADLKEDVVVQWVKDTLTEENVTQIEAALETQINEQRTPSVASGVPVGFAE